MAKSDAKTADRIPNKTLWSLDAIQEQCIEHRVAWRKLMDIAEKRLDPEMALYLARTRDAVAEIERLASDAQNGKFSLIDD